jgi:SAM-dependent methyltransferase
MYRNPRIYDRVLALIHGESYNDRFARIAAMVAPDQTVLDVGCGTCQLARFLPGRRYIGIDLNPVFIVDAVHRGIDARIIDVFDRHSYPHGVDVIVSCDMLHHVFPRDCEYVQQLGAAGIPLVVFAETVMVGATFFQKLCGLILDNDGFNDIRARFHLHLKAEYTMEKYREIFESNITYKSVQYQQFQSPGYFFRKKKRLQLHTLIGAFQV